MYQRSADMFLGMPFNIASYALFTHMIAQVCNLEVGDLIISVGDAHIYENHIEQVKEQLKRKPLPLSTLQLTTEIEVITDFDMDDIELVGYESHDAIKAPMAV
jgi:thymidylate synthase